MIPETQLTAAEDKVSINEFWDNIEGFRCVYAILPNVFRFFAGESKYIDVPRNGQDYPDHKTMSQLSFPIAYADKMSLKETDNWSYKLETMTWDSFCARYKVNRQYK